MRTRFLVILHIQHLALYHSAHFRKVGGTSIAAFSYYIFTTFFFFLQAPDNRMLAQSSNVPFLQNRNVPFRDIEALTSSQERGQRYGRYYFYEQQRTHSR